MPKTGGQRNKRDRDKERKKSKIGRKEGREGGREREEEKEPCIKFQSIRLALLLHFSNI